MRIFLRRLAIHSILATILWCGAFIRLAEATTFDPNSFASLGSLSAAGLVTINTDTLEMGGNAAFTGILDVSGSAIFTFDDIHATNITVIGSHPLALLSKSNASISGTFDLLGGDNLEIDVIGLLAIHNLFASNDVLLHANEIIISGIFDLGNNSLTVILDTVANPGGGIIITTPPVISVTTVPEPSTWLLFASGLVGLAAWRRKIKA